MTAPLAQSDDNGPVAMQPRCPHCDTEQYMFAVYEFSHGELPCGRCHQLSRPMTHEQYHDALRLTRGESA